MLFLFSCHLEDSFDFACKILKNNIYILHTHTLYKTGYHHFKTWRSHQVRKVEGSSRLRLWSFPLFDGRNHCQSLQPQTDRGSLRAANLTTQTSVPVCIELSGLRKVPQFVTHKAWPQLPAFSVFVCEAFITPYQARHWETWEYPSVNNPSCRHQHGKMNVSNACLSRNWLTHCFEWNHNTRSISKPR